MGQEEIVLSVEHQLQRDMEQHTKSYDSFRTRLVWFVAIAGFVLLNGKSLYDSIGSRPLVSYEILLVNIPILLSAIFTLITHILSDYSESTSNDYYNLKITFLELFKSKVHDKRGELPELESIITDNKVGLPQIRKKLDRWVKIVNIIESISILLLVASFVWIILYPLFLIQ